MSRLPRAISPISPNSLAWQAYKLRERLAVMQRRLGVCEGCGKTVRSLEWAHIFGRRQIVGEPWASSRYLTTGLCHWDLYTNEIGCHEKIDRYLDPELRANLEEAAVGRIYDAFNVKYVAVREPAGSLRELVATIEREWEPDAIAKVMHLRPGDGLRARRSGPSA